MNGWRALVRTKSWWTGLAVIVVALGSYFADENSAEAARLAGRGVIEIVLALVGAGIITQRSAIAKLAAQVTELSKKIEQAQSTAQQNEEQT